MKARHFVVWVDGTRTHVATRNAYRNGEASWRCDEALSVPVDLVEELGREEWQTPSNGPFPVFSSDVFAEVVAWLKDNGYTAVALDEPPA